MTCTAFFKPQFIYVKKVKTNQKNKSNEYDKYTVFNQINYI